MATLSHLLGNKRHRIVVVQIHDREREMVEQIAPRSEQILGPPLRRLADCFERFDNLQDKCRPRLVAAFAVPLVGGLNLSPRKFSTRYGLGPAIAQARCGTVPHFFLGNQPRLP